MENVQLTWITNSIWGIADNVFTEPGYLPTPEDNRIGIKSFLRSEVLLYSSYAWYNPDSVKVGYEINFNRYFYKPKSLRSLEEIWADLLAVQKEAEGLLEEILGGCHDTTKK